MNEINLLPCPLCGGVKLEIVKCEAECCSAQTLYIECPCGLSLDKGNETDNELFERWNKRVNK